MPSLLFDADISRLESRLTDMAQSQVPFASAVALNEVIEAAAADASDEMERRFDRPTPFTKRGIGTRKARKDSLVGQVHLRPVQAEYLRLQIEGGTRVNTSGKTYLPTPVDVRLNRYGNFTRNAIRNMLNSTETGKRGGRAKTVFTRELSNGSVGVFRRLKSGQIKLLLTFDREQEYEPRYPFQDIVISSALFNWRKAFGAALGRAIASADARAKARAFGLR